MNTYVVLDIETTGLNPLAHEIIEIGAIKVKNDVVVEEFNELINPGVEITEFITKLTGITNEMVQDCDTPRCVLERFHTFIDDVDVLIGHNIDRFDFPFISHHFNKHRLAIKSYQTIDTVLLAKATKEMDSYRLDALCDHYQIVIEDRHRAFGDVYATYQLYDLHLCHQLDKYDPSQRKDDSCPKCQTGRLVERKGMYGPFKGCSNYPTCKHTVKIKKA